MENNESAQRTAAPEASNRKDQSSSPEHQADRLSAMDMNVSSNRSKMNHSPIDNDENAVVIFSSAADNPTLLGLSNEKPKEINIPLLSEEINSNESKIKNGLCDSSYCRDESSLTNSNNCVDSSRDDSNDHDDPSCRPVVKAQTTTTMSPRISKSISQRPDFNDKTEQEEFNCNQSLQTVPVINVNGHASDGDCHVYSRAVVKACRGTSQVTEGIIPMNCGHIDDTAPDSSVVKITSESSDDFDINRDDPNVEKTTAITKDGRAIIRCSLVEASPKKKEINLSKTIIGETSAGEEKNSSELNLPISSATKKGCPKSNEILQRNLDSNGYGNGLVSSGDGTMVILPDVIAPPKPACCFAAEETAVEEEWVSMGLGLGDALRQIVTLTEERDAAVAMCQTSSSSSGNENVAQAEALLVEVQSRLESEMNKRAEFEAEVRELRETLMSYEQRLENYERMEDDLEKAHADLVTVVSEKSKMEMEVEKLRDSKDELERKEAVLSNRLNEAKKKEANKSSVAGRLEEDNESLKKDLQRALREVESLSQSKAKLESNMEKLKAKAVERVKQAENALMEERELNEERKKKMKIFVETKAEELREAKESANDVQKELHDSRSSLRASRDREEALLNELESVRIKHRELQRDLERMKRSSEQLHKMGNNLEQELEKSASETEEHKNKRMAAKHELMTMVRTLEVERAISGKLRESIKFTFTPKALSQQQLLTECLQEFEGELEKLATKIGKPLSSHLDSNLHGSKIPTSGDHNDDEINPAESNTPSAAKKVKKSSRVSKVDMDTDRLISNLEQETQHVSRGIMSLVGNIERMRSLLSDDTVFGCMTYFSHFIAGQGEARHQRLDEGSHNPDREESVSITSFEQDSRQSTNRR